MDFCCQNRFYYQFIVSILLLFFKFFIIFDNIQQEKYKINQMEIYGQLSKTSECLHEINIVFVMNSAWSSKIPLAFDYHKR